MFPAVHILYFAEPCYVYCLLVFPLSREARRRGNKRGEIMQQRRRGRRRNPQAAMANAKL